MTWIVFAIGVLAAAAMLNAYVPARLRVLVIPGFFAAWLTIELAQHTVLALSAVLVGLWWWSPDVFVPWPSATGAALIVVAIVGNFGLLWRAHQTGHSIREFYTSASLVPALSPRYPRSHLAIPWLAFHRRDVEVRRNIVYATVSREGSPAQALHLDFWQARGPRSGPARRPALLQVHGGAWVLGYREYQGIPLLAHMTTRGWVGFNVEYRLSPRATWPDHIIDIKRALAWIREHADEYGVDPDFIVITGGSAGGHLAALAALTAGDPTFQPDFPNADTSVRAAIIFYGVYDLGNRKYRRLLERAVLKHKYEDDPQAFIQASPIARVHADAPPFLLAHGTRDTLTPYQDAINFATALRAVSRNPVYTLSLTGAEHAFDIFPSVRAVQVYEACEQFLSREYATYCGAHPTDSPGPRT